MTHEEFIVKANYTRKTNKNRWYILHENVEGRNVILKGFNTYLRIYTVNGVSHGGKGNITVKTYLSELIEPFI